MTSAGTADGSVLEKLTVLCALSTTSGRILSHWCNRRWQQDPSLPPFSFSSLALLVASVYALGKQESSGRMDCWPCWKVVYISNQPNHVMVLLAVPTSNASETFLDWMEFKCWILLSEILDQFGAILPELLKVEEQKLLLMAHSYTLGNALENTNTTRQLQSSGGAMLNVSMVHEIIHFSFEMLTEKLKGTIDHFEAYARPITEEDISKSRISRAILYHARRKRSMYEFPKPDEAVKSSISGSFYVSELIQVGADALDELCQLSSSSEFILFIPRRYPHASSTESFRIAMHSSATSGPFVSVICFSCPIDTFAMKCSSDYVRSISQCPKLGQCIERAQKRISGYEFSLGKKHVPASVQKLLSLLLDCHDFKASLTLDDIEATQDDNTTIIAQSQASCSANKSHCARFPERV